MVDLLACPFCGDDGEKGIQQVTMMNDERTKFNRTICRCCGAMAPELNWQQRATQPSAQEEPFGYWSKFADGSEVFIHRLPTNPDYEDMPSKSIPLYTHQVAKQEPLSEAQIMKCIAAAGCYGTVKMSFESGPYSIDRPSINADKFVRTIEAAHGIGKAPRPSAPTGQINPDSVAQGKEQS